jgi:hypothetical protein
MVLTETLGLLWIEQPSEMFLCSLKLSDASRNLLTEEKPVRN